MRWLCRILLTFMFLMPISLMAGRNITPAANIGPSSAAANVTIAAAGTGKRNCITDLDVLSDSAYTLRILDGGTTTYAMTLGASAGLVRSWDVDDAFCGSANAAMYINVSAGTPQINYKGFSY
jgi:hypothetical protein